MLWPCECEGQTGSFLIPGGGECFKQPEVPKLPKMKNSLYPSLLIYLFQGDFLIFRYRLEQ